MADPLPPAPPAGCHLRFARPSNDLEAVVRFYRDGLGFELLGGFEDHEGFDGVMLGHPGAPVHLEFTRELRHVEFHEPSPDQLIVIYLPDPDAWWAAVWRLERMGHRSVPAHNPYWDVNGTDLI